MGGSSSKITIDATRGLWKDASLQKKKITKVPDLSWMAAVSYKQKAS